MEQESSRQAVHQYAIVTGNYWGFTLTDGALRMLVVLHFHHLGFTPLSIAMLFLFYELFGVITNLVGGWLGASFGLNRTMNLGLFLQIVALAMLLVPSAYLTVVWVMAAQALSGIAKDLNKMSAKSAIKALVPEDQNDRLFRWVAFLTGSKNTLKGAGFFMGGLLLTLFGFTGALLAMALGLLAIWLFSLASLKQDLGRRRLKPSFRNILSKNRAINTLSAARVFLFGARDVWFVVALPVFLNSQLGWSYTSVGGFLAVWIILYGVVQALTPKLVSPSNYGRSAFLWVVGLAITPFLISLGLMSSLPIAPLLVVGLLVFGAVFAVNSALHSFLIVYFASSEDISLDVGFYYMANATGRLFGTVLSGALFQVYGYNACLIASGTLLLFAAWCSWFIETNS